MIGMTKHGIILAMVLIGIAACSPNKQQGLRSLAGNAAATTSADAGHTPHPVAPVVDEDLFHGWKCGGGDCSTHQAGYAWAAQHKIANPQDCKEKLEKSKSESFIEGCWAYTGAEGPFGQREIFQDED